MHTLMSIEKGFIPLNIGKFNDHEINKCAIELELSSDKLLPYNLYNIIVSKEINEMYEPSNLYEKIDNYNSKQKLYPFKIILKNGVYT